MKKNKLFSFSNFFIGCSLFIGTTTLLKLVLWPIFANRYHYLLALGLMFLSAITARYLLILLYDYIKIDFGKIERRKSGKKYKPNYITRKIDKSKKIGGKLGINIGLAILDPAIMVIYSRLGSFNWNGFQNNKIRFLFLLSNLIGVLIFGTLAEIIF